MVTDKVIDGISADVQREAGKNIVVVTEEEVR